MRGILVFELSKNKSFFVWFNSPDGRLRLGSYIYRRYRHYIRVTTSGLHTRYYSAYRNNRQIQKLILDCFKKKLGIKSFGKTVKIGYI